MQKNFTFILSLILIGFIATGCSHDTEEPQEQAAPQKEETAQQAEPTTQAIPTTEEEIKKMAQEVEDKIEEAEKMMEETKTATTEKINAGQAIYQIAFTNVSNNKEFKIADFLGKPILLESFAVWCPTCLKQQKEMRQLKIDEGDSIIHISLDTDPNEDAELVKKHIVKNNLNWLFAVSPASATKALIDEFGLDFVNAPAAPVVLICPNGDANFLKRGVKTSSEIKANIANLCS